MTSMEVALCFGLFVMLVFGVMDLSRYFFTRQALTTLVTSTARLGYAGTLSSQNPSTRTLAAEYAPLLDSDPKVLSLTWNINRSSGVTVLTVNATYNYTSLTPMLDSLVGQLQASMTYQY